jgi:hypothetical protein
LLLPLQAEPEEGSTEEQKACEFNENFEH